MSTFIEDAIDLDEHAPARAAPTAPKAYARRADTWAAKAIPTPAWATRYAKSGVLPSEAERADNAPGGTIDEAQELEATRSYFAAWRDLVWRMSKLKSECALVIVANRSGTPAYAAAVNLACAVDAEWHRLAAARRAHRPLVLRTFTPLDMGLAESMDSARLASSSTPLFDGRAAAAGPDVGFDDLSQSGPDGFGAR